LFLYNSKTLDKPNFFLSATLEKDKHKYYRLLNDTRNNKWADWVEFFLESINTQAKNDIVRLKNIEISYEDTINKAKHVIKSNKIIDIIDMLYGKPICTAKNIAEFTGIPIRTCRKYLNILEDEKIIYSDQKIRNKIYYNYDLLNLIR
jgi:Fic family protein